MMFNFKIKFCVILPAFQFRMKFYFKKTDQLKGRHFDADTVHWFCRPGWGGCPIACVWTGHHRGGGAGWGCPPVLLLHHGLPGPATAQRDPTGHKCTHRHQQGKCTNSKSCIILITVILMASHIYIIRWIILSQQKWCSVQIYRNLHI